MGTTYLLPGRFTVVQCISVAFTEMYRRGLSRVNKKWGPRGEGPLLFVVGGVLLSHTLPGAVPSAFVGLASGFGMGPGVSQLLSPPTRSSGFNPMLLLCGLCGVSDIA